MHATCEEVFDNKYASIVLNRQHQNHKLLEKVQHTFFSEFSKIMVSLRLEKIVPCIVNTSLAMTHVSKKFLRCCC